MGYGAINTMSHYKYIKIISKNINMKKIIIILLSLLVFVSMYSQSKIQYLHFSIGEGLHNLSYLLQNGTEKAKSGFTINAAYSYFFTPEWGLQAGLGLQSYNTLSTLNYLSTTPNVIDAVGDSYEYRNNYKNWQEKQHALFIDIPIKAQYRHFFTSKLGILASGGMKISVPVHASYKTVGGEMVTTGYYSKWNVLLSDLPQHGFGTYTDSYSNNLSLKPVCMVIADLGGLYKLSENLDFYLGGYINYGLNDVIPTSSKLVFQPDGVYNGFLGSDQVSKAKLFALGLKVGIYWKMGKKKVEEIPEIVFMPKAPVDEAIDDKEQMTIISDTKINPVEPITISVHDTISKSIDSKSEPYTNAITKQLGNKDSLQKEGLMTDTIEKLKLIATSTTFNTDSVSQHLQVDSKNTKELKTVSTSDSGITPKAQDHSDNRDIVNVDSKTESSIDTLGASLTIDTQKTKTDEKSRLIDLDGDGIPDYLDKCPNLAGVVSNQGCPEIKREVRRLFRRALTGIKFDSSRDKFKKKSYPVLNQIAVELIKNPTYLIEVRGHTDSKGYPQANKSLSELRASAVRNYLIQKGVNGDRIKSIGYGDTKPIATNKSVKGRASNRRVEFIVVFE
jgi:outer membrane protein OmpA-like peptidoglycan-associated protein